MFQPTWYYTRTTTQTDIEGHTENYYTFYEAQLNKLAIFLLCRCHVPVFENILFRAPSLKRPTKRCCIFPTTTTATLVKLLLMVAPEHCQRLILLQLHTIGHPPTKPSYTSVLRVFRVREYRRGATRFIVFYGRAAVVNVVRTIVHNGERDGGTRVLLLSRTLPCSLSPPPPSED